MKIGDKVRVVTTSGMDEYAGVQESMTGVIVYIDNDFEDGDVLWGVRFDDPIKGHSLGGILGGVSTQGYLLYGSQLEVIEDE